MPDWVGFKDIKSELISATPLALFGPSALSSGPTGTLWPLSGTAWLSLALSLDPWHSLAFFFVLSLALYGIRPHPL